MQGILAAYAIGQPPQGPQPAAMRHPLALLLAILAVLTVVAAVGGFLNYRYHTQQAGRAQQYFTDGNALMAKDLYDSAIEKYRDALSLSHNAPYRLALALALVKAGQPNEAAIYLDEFLRKDPHSGPANLGMAQVATQQGRLDDAVSYYHRAMYGAWPDHPEQRRADARIDLIEMLGAAGRRQQAQGELLSLLSSLPGGIAIRKEVAPLLLVYSLPKEAAALFKEITDQEATDEDGFAGLGEADFDLADYSAARDALQIALRLNPNDTSVSQRLAACNQILALDPTQRGLPAQQRFARSRQVLADVLEALGACTAPGLRERADAARKLVQGKLRPRSFGDAATQNDALAEELWSAGGKVCGALAAPDAPLSRVMARVMAK